jgi:hypothetical protein
MTSKAVENVEAMWLSLSTMYLKIAAHGIQTPSRASCYFLDQRILHL